MKRVSKPRASNETPLWTTYTYDVLGRTTLVTLLPDGGQPSAGLTSYLDHGAAVKMTDPAGQCWLCKQDAFGSWVEVPAQRGSRSLP